MSDSRHDSLIPTPRVAFAALTVFSLLQSCAHDADSVTSDASRPIASLGTTICALARQPILRTEPDSFGLPLPEPDELLNVFGIAFGRFGDVDATFLLGCEHGYINKLDYRSHFTGGYQCNSSSLMGEQCARSSGWACMACEAGFESVELVALRAGLSQNGISMVVVADFASGPNHGRQVAFLLERTDGGTQWSIVRSHIFKVV